MWFAKLYPKKANWPWQQVASWEYQFYTECSKGRAWIKLEKTHTKKPLWRWEVQLWHKGKAEGLPINKQIVYWKKNGADTSLYRAARVVLQHLLSYRRAPLSELLRILANDQAMWELANL